MADDSDTNVDDMLDISDAFRAFSTTTGSSFTMSVDDEPTEEVQIAVRLTKASAALNEFLDYAEENDLDPTEIDPMTFEQLDHNERLLITAFSPVAQAMVRFGNMAEDNDDENPFKVGDGDDPIY